MRYRAEVDGLRAVAVVSVILFHAGFNFFSGGFVGVDIFFVISGYLITSIILSEMERGEFSLLHFYERRARRILPALFFIVVVCIPFAWFLLTPDNLKDFMQSLVAVSVFSSNILFWNEGDYFASAAELKPLLHTWSLAVEEQYYILFPLLLMLFWKLGKQWIIGTLLLMTMLSLGLMQWGIFHYPEATFYLLPTRGWEILLGAFIALYINRFGAIKASPLFRQILSLVGFALICYSIFKFDSQTPFPSFYALIPTVGAVLIIAFTNAETAIYRILSNKIMVGIGLISYSTYLWHQPLLAFARQRSLTEPPFSLLSALMFLTFILAYFTWRYIEKPFRGKSKISRNSVFLMSCVAACGLILFGLLGHFNAGWGNRKLDNNLTMADLDAYTKINYGLSDVCDGAYTEKDECLYGENPTVLLWGDSYAMHLAQSLVASKTPVSFRQHTISVCRPLMGVSIVGNGQTKDWAQNCIDHNNKVYEWLKLNNSVEYVILASPFTFMKYDLMTENGRESYNIDLVLKQAKETVMALHDLGKKVIFIGPPPTTKYNIGQCYVKAVLFNEPVERCNFSEDAFSKETKEVREFIKKTSFFAPTFSFENLICQEGVCFASMENTNIYRDEGHLSKSGSAYLGQKYDVVGEIMKKADRFWRTP